jgi:hypothetical protein
MLDETDTSIQYISEYAITQSDHVFDNEHVP